MAASNKSTKAKQEKGKAYATAAAARGQSFFPGQKKTPITPQLKERLDRLSVIWCVQSGRPWTALTDPGHKLMLAEFVPEYAATDTSHQVLNKILLEMYQTAKASLVAQLKGAYEELQKIGYHGPFCCLQLDLTLIGTDEFCTASVSVILSNDKLPRHLNLATKVFRGQHTQTTIKTWIEQLTTGIFESIVPAMVPSDVYVAATVDQGLNVVNACKSLGIPTNPCLGHRIHSSVMWGIGVNGSATTQKNKKGRALVGKCAAC
ncbi:unnamed protein product, partial [Ectocarpus sp. 12 AP-2014]